MENHKDASAVDLAVVLGKVILIYFDQFSLYLRNLCRIFVFYPGGDTFRHTADDEIVVVRLKQAVMKDVFDLLSLPDVLIVSEQSGIGCIKKLVKGERTDIKKIYHAYRIGLRFCQKCSQQTACCNDMIFVCFLPEVFEGVQCLGTFLDLIEDDQCFTRLNLFPADHGKKLNDALRILVRLEDRFQLIFFIKVEIGEAVIAVSSELLHQPSLANLSCAFQHHRLALFTGLPVYQILNCIALQGNHRPFEWSMIG